MTQKYELIWSHTSEKKQKNKYFNTSFMYMDDLKDIIADSVRTLPREYFETLQFKDLKPGEKFIAFPFPGDNSGHGGFNGEHYIFKKIRGEENYGGLRSFDGSVSSFPEDMYVIKVK